jgi:hypothetical protein
MKRLVLLLVLGASAFIAAPAQAHFVGLDNVIYFNHYSPGNISGVCGEGGSWACDKGTRSQWTVVGFDYDGDGNIRVGDHSYGMYARWKEYAQFNPLNHRTCELYFRQTHYDIPVYRYTTKTCWG